MECFKLIQDISFINNRIQICVFERYKYFKNVLTIPWRYISRIIFYCDERQTCCICLNKLFLPRMNKCGHIFCLTCLLSLCNFHETENILCPLCKTCELQKINLKRVKLVNISDVTIGEQIVLQMMVKGMQSCIPFPGFKLVPAISNVLLPSLECNYNYSYVSYDPDEKTEIYIETDLQCLELRRESIINNNGEEIYNETKNFLNEEYSNYECYDRVVDRSYQFIKNARGDKFNLLSFERYLNTFNIYFQSPHRKYILLNLEDTKLIIDQYRCLKRIPPIVIKGEIVFLEKEVINKEFIERTNINHIPLGSTVTWVKLDKSNIQYNYLYGDYLEKLQNAKRKMLKHEQRKAEMSEENDTNQMSVQNGNREYTYLQGIIQERVQEENFKFLNLHEEEDVLFKCNENQGFNTCTLGIECVVPDNLYPHSPTCIYYKKFDELKNENQTDQVDINGAPCSVMGNIEYINGPPEEIISSGSSSPTQLSSSATLLHSTSIFPDANRSSDTVIEDGAAKYIAGEVSELEVVQEPIETHKRG